MLRRVGDNIHQRCWALLIYDVSVQQLMKGNHVRHPT